MRLAVVVNALYVEFSLEKAKCYIAFASKETKKDLDQQPVVGIP